MVVQKLAMPKLDPKNISFLARQSMNTKRRQKSQKLRDVRINDKCSYKCSDPESAEVI